MSAKVVLAQMTFTEKDYVLPNFNPVLLNPSYAGFDLKREFTLHHTNHFGVRKIINSSHFHFSQAINDQQSSQIGLLVQSHNEGKFIQNNNLQLLVNYNILKKDTSNRNQLIVGLFLGASNLRIKSNGQTSQGSDWTSMNSIGILYTHKKSFRWGLSFKNIISTKLSPIKESYTFPREGISYFEKTFLLSLQSDIQFNYLLFISETSTNHLVTLKYSYLKKYYCSIGMKDLSLIWGIGIEELKIGKEHFKIAFGSSLWSSLSLNSNKYDLLFSYYFH